MIISRAKYLAAMRHIYAKKDARYYLNYAVHVARHPTRGTLLVSTNGHSLLVIHDIEAVGWGDIPDGGITFDVSAAETLLGARKSADLPVTLEPTADALAFTLTLGGTSMLIHAVDCKFPDWRRVLPTASTAAAQRPAATYAGRYLAAFASVVDTLLDPAERRAEKCGMRITAADANSGAVVLFEHVPNAVGLLMPMRAGGMPEHLPEWLSAK